MTVDLNKNVKLTTGDGDVVLSDKQTGNIIALSYHDVKKLYHEVEHKY